MAIFSAKFIESFLRLTRAWNLIIIGLAQYFTAYFLLKIPVIDNFQLHLLVVSTLMIAAAGYIINDYYDVKIDFINKPDRVVVGKSIGRRYAILFHVLLSASGMAIGFFLGWRILAVHFLSVFLLWWYSNNLKRLPFIGNFSVAMLTGLSILIVNFLYRENNQLVIIYALFAAFMTLVREIIKDMEDLKGDNSFGCRTLPIVWGIRKTKIVIYVTLLAFVITVFVINYSSVQLPIGYFIGVLFLPVVILAQQLYRADTIKSFSRLSSLCKLIMLLGILSMSIV